MRDRRVTAREVFPTALATVLLVITGCGSGARHPPPSNPLIGRPQAGILRLTAGPSTNHFTIIAPPPSKYPWNAVITAPSAVDVSVMIRTWYGVDLGVLDSSHDTGSCTIRRARSTCLSRLPILEAQRAGRWTVIATKRAGPAATVHIAITFIQP